MPVVVGDGRADTAVGGSGDASPSGTMDPLTAHLREAGLSQHLDAFRAAGVDHLSVMSLTMQDYTTVGVTSASDRRKLFELIQTMKRDSSIPPNRIRELRKACTSLPMSPPLSAEGSAPSQADEGMGALPSTMQHTATATSSGSGGAGGIRRTTASGGAGKAITPPTEPTAAPRARANGAGSTGSNAHPSPARAKAAVAATSTPETLVPQPHPHTRAYANGSSTAHASPVRGAARMGTASASPPRAPVVRRTTAAAPDRSPARDSALLAHNNAARFGTPGSAEQRSPAERMVPKHVATHSLSLSVSSVNSEPVLLDGVMMHKGCSLPVTQLTLGGRVAPVAVPTLPVRKATAATRVPKGSTAAAAAAAVRASDGATRTKGGGGRASGDAAGSSGPSHHPPGGAAARSVSAGWVERGPISSSSNVAGHTATAAARHRSQTAAQPQPTQALKVPSGSKGTRKVPRATAAANDASDSSQPPPTLAAVQQERRGSRPIRVGAPSGRDPYQRSTSSSAPLPVRAATRARVGDKLDALGMLGSPSRGPTQVSASPPRPTANRSHHNSIAFSRTQTDGPRRVRSTAQTCGHPAPAQRSTSLDDRLRKPVGRGGKSASTNTHAHAHASAGAGGGGDSGGSVRRASHTSAPQARGGGANGSGHRESSSPSRSSDACGSTDVASPWSAAQLPPAAAGPPPRARRSTGSTRARSNSQHVDSASASCSPTGEPVLDLVQDDASVDMRLRTKSCDRMIAPRGGLKRIAVCVRKKPMAVSKPLEDAYMGDDNREGGNGNGSGGTGRGSKKNTDIVEIQDAVSLNVAEPKIRVDLTTYTQRHPFVFDEVLSDRSDNWEVYRRTVAPLIPQIFQGGRSTCFAYGQTGSGKTHTMIGAKSEKGVYLLAAEEVFRSLLPGQYVTVNAYEIYGTKLFDLLDKGKRVEAREDSKGAVQICGLSEHRCATADKLMKAVEKGQGRRALGATGANEQSSRSHAVVAINVKCEKGAQFVGGITFIDLAGSERGSDTRDNDRTTRMEGASINRSLLALKECIRALDAQQRHVPFRGSKLTEVLRDSFTGKLCRTVMIACISPLSSNCEHTLNTLRYAYRVKELKRKPGGSLDTGDANQTAMLSKSLTHMPCMMSPYQNPAHMMANTPVVHVDSVPAALRERAGGGPPGKPLPANGTAGLRSMSADSGVGVATGGAPKSQTSAGGLARPKASGKGKRSVSANVPPRKQVPLPPAQQQQQQDADMLSQREHIHEVMELMGRKMLELSDQWQADSRNSVQAGGGSVEEYLKEVDGMLTQVTGKMTGLRDTLTTYRNGLAAPQQPPQAQAQRRTREQRSGRSGRGHVVQGR